MSARFEFQPTLWPTLAAAAGIALALALGNWQLGRGQEKTALGERLEQRARGPEIHVSTRELAAGEVELRRVEARGVFEPKYMILVDNRVRRGIPGYHVVMPLRLGDGSRYVLVNRGWVAAGPDRGRPPEIRTPRGEIGASGLAVVPGRRVFELSDRVAEGRVWQNLTLERYRQAVPIPIQPFLIQQDPEGAPDDGLVREWLPPDLGVDRHYGYAFQWFALAALILIFYVVTHVRRKHKT
ncbi:MAG: SURF1 family protein [Betaproteobacteria bacterium]|nr:SURF1 family protein [Betaproteobacteria bacterium]